MEKEQPIRCTATTAAGRACRAWAVRGTDPPRCAAHGGRQPEPGGLVAQIDDLDARIARLGAYLDARREELALGELCRLLDLHSKMMGRVTRMRQALTGLDRAGGDEQSALLAAYNQALDDLAEEWGMVL